MINNPAVWFELPANDIDRAKKFYEALLGIAIERRDFNGYEMAWFPSNMDSWGTSGALMKGEGYVPSAKGAVVYFTCSDIPETLKRGEAAGGKTLLRKKPIGEYGFIAWIADSEGNTVGLHSME